MKKSLRFVLPLTLVALFTFAERSPAPIIYRDGEGISTGDLTDIEIKKNAQEQYDLGERYEQSGDFKRAGASYRLVVRRFPRSDIAAKAQYQSGRMLEKEGQLQRAFYEYQILVERYPHSPDFEAALEAEYNIAKAFLDGRRVDVYGIPTLPSMAKAQEMFTKIVTNAPFSRIAPLAQYGIGQALEKSGSISATVNAYQQVVDRYPNSDVADDAMYQIGYVYFQASRNTGYDQTAAVRAQESYEDFLLRYPNSEKVPQAKDNLKALTSKKTENSYTIAKFYDKQKNYKAAYVYYNEVIQQQPDSEEAQQAKVRMDQIRAKVGEDKLKIGSDAPVTPQMAQQGALQKKSQAQVETTTRPDFVGPPAPTPTPSPNPSTTTQKPMRTAPEDVPQPAPTEPAAAQPVPSPAEPALPSQ
jgi:outer membrane protein assembly factor BamD